MGYEVSSGQVSSGISLTNDYMFVFNGGTAKSTTVNEAGSMHLEGGGSATDTTVNEAGSMTVAGVAHKTVLNGTGYWTPGKMSVLDGGAASSTTVNSGGSMSVDKGGTANETTVNDAGSMHVSSGGVANSTVVNSGGSLYVDESGTAAEVTVNGGGVLDIRNGGVAVTIRENGGYVNIADGANAVFTANSFSGLQLLNDSATLHSGTTATSATVDEFGKLFIYAGGVANSTAVNSKGNLYVSSRGRADSTVVNDCGSMSVLGGGAASTTIVNSGGDLYIDKSGTADNTVVNENGCLHVSGAVNGTTVNGVDEWNFGELYVGKGGTASATTVNSFGRMRIAESGAANGITVNGGGNLVVSSGAVATAIKENGGYVEVADGASATFVTNTFSGLTLTDDAATLHAGTTANSTTVNTSGELYVYEGGVANGTVLTGTDRENCGEMYVYSGGAANGTTVGAGGWVYVVGTANSTTVNGDGYLGIAKGGRHTGTMSIAEGAVVSAYAGSVIDFDISSSASGDAAIVDALSRIQGAPDYTLTVGGAQASGVYTLAAGAAGFDKAITVKDTVGATLGTLTVAGGETEIGGVKYKLALNGSALTLEVGGSGPGDVFDFDISGITPPNDPLADLSTVSASAFTLTVGGAQASGVYTLADGAAGFDRAITVRNTSGDTLGTLTVGVVADIDGTNCRLDLNQSELLVAIGVSVVPEPDNGWNDYLWTKKDGWNSDENIAKFTSNKVVGNGEIRLDLPGTVEKKGAHNLFGRDAVNTDTGDVAHVSVAQAAKLTFEIKSDAAGTFYVYEDGLKKNKRTLITLGKVSVKAGGTATLKDVCLTATGNYYVAMTAKNVRKVGTEGLYNVSVIDHTFFDDADKGENNTPDGGRTIPVGRGQDRNIVLDNDPMTGSTEFDNFVGFTDRIDYAKLELSSGAYLSFHVTGEGDGKAKFTVWKQAANGRLSKVANVSLPAKKAYDATTRAQFLDADKFTYYVSMECTDADKGRGVYYNVEVADGAVFFDSADDRKNDELYDRKAKKFCPEDADHHFEITTVGANTKVKLDSDPVAAPGWENFVGYGDAVDYAKIELTGKGKLSFSLEATGDAAFTFYRKGEKNGKETLETVQAVKLAVEKGRTTAVQTLDVLPALDAGEYYVSMAAKNTKPTDKGSVFYNVTAFFTAAEADAVEMPMAASSYAESVQNKLFDGSANGLLASL